MIHSISGYLHQNYPKEKQPIVCQLPKILAVLCKLDNNHQWYKINKYLIVCGGNPFSINFPSNFLMEN
jgi:hypothetical protein